MFVTQQKVEMEGGPYKLEVHLELIHYGKWLGKRWGLIAFLSLHVRTHVDPNIPVSGVWRVGNAPDVGNPKMSLGSSHPSCTTGGKSHLTSSLCFPQLSNGGGDGNTSLADLTQPFYS